MGIGWGGGIGGGLAQGATERRSLAPLSRRGLGAIRPRLIGPHHSLLRRESNVAPALPILLKREVDVTRLRRRAFNMKAIKGLFGIGLGKRRQ